MRWQDSERQVGQISHVYAGRMPWRPTTIRGLMSLDQVRPNPRHDERTMKSPAMIRAWFAADCVLAPLPPLHRPVALFDTSPSEHRSGAGAMVGPSYDVGKVF